MKGSKTYSRTIEPLRVAGFASGSERLKQSRLPNSVRGFNLRFDRGYRGPQTQRLPGPSAKDQRNLKRRYSAQQHIYLLLESSFQVLDALAAFFDRPFGRKPRCV